MLRSILYLNILTGLVPLVFSAPVQNISKRDSRTTAPSGCLVVGSNGDYSTISSALTALGSSKSDACIFIASGTYKEQLSIDYSGSLTLYGETTDTSDYSNNGVTITHTISSSAAGSLDKSSTVNIVSSNFSMYNINVENGYGTGAQAVAVTANADSLGFYGCSFLGYQDTLYAKSGTQYYSKCYIEGAVDYIFGDASAWFTGCNITSNGAGYITADSRTTSDDSSWYVFDNVNVQAASGVDLSGKVYLGRPWRGLARVMYQNSELSDIINTAGWATMAAGATPYYYEYNNSGAGSDTSGRKYETKATGAVSIDTVLGSDYTSWVDLTAASSGSSSAATTSSAKASAKASTKASTIATSSSVASTTPSSSAVIAVKTTKSSISSSTKVAGTTSVAAPTTTAAAEDDDTCDASDDEETSSVVSAPATVESTTAAETASTVQASSVTSSVTSATKAAVTTKAASSAVQAQAVSSTTATGAVCTPTSGGSASTDDTPAITEALTTCGKGGTIVIPAGKTYYLNTVLDFTGCESCDFQLEGTLKASDDLTYWEGKTAIIYLASISGAKIRSVTGSGVIDGNGQAAYDKFASDSSYKRPTLFYIKGGSNLEITGFKMINPPNVYHSVNGGATNVLYSDLNMTSLSTSKNAAKNTDGFDIGASTFVSLYNITVSNQDDCVAFKPGANYTTVDTITCNGSHGLSVGSLGKTNDDSVANIYVTNAVMIDSAKAVGIKTYPGGHGHSTVTNVTYSGVTVKNSDYAIQIQSCYGETASYCTSNPGDATLSGIVFENFSGTTSSKYSPTTSNIDCGSKGTCDITISGYTVKASSGTGKVVCANTPSTLGVTCSSGASG